MLQLVDAIFAYPVITMPRATKLLYVTSRSAQLNIDKLVKANIMRETTGRERYRIHIAPEIIKILEASE